GLRTAEAQQQRSRQPDGDERDRRDGQPDARHGGAERQVEAGLYPVAAGGAGGGDGLGQQDEQRDDDADGGLRHPGGGDARLGAGLGGEGGQDEAEGGQGRDGGERAPGTFGVEDGDVAAQGADEQRQAQDAVARDHDGREDGVPRQRVGLGAAADHQGHDEGD